MNDETAQNSIGTMRDILDIEDVIRSPWDDVLRIVLAVVLALAAGYLLFRLFKYVKNRFFPSVDSLPPFQRAQRALKELQAKNHASRSEWGAFYFQLSEILKCYFSDRFHTDIIDKTTEEIVTLKRLHVPPLEEGEWEIFKKFLVESDFVKFAKFPATVAQTEEDFIKVQRLIKNAESRSGKNSDERDKT